MEKPHDISRDNIRDWLSENQHIQPSAKDIGDTENALQHFASAYSLNPPAGLREKILDNISRLNQQKAQRQPIQPDQLPLLDSNANWLDWAAAVEGIAPPEDFENIHLHTLESNDQRELFVVWVKEYVEEEVHHDLLESFLILEGACECHITDEKGVTRTVRMRQGDFITMQLGETHDLLITSSEPTKAILQWRKLAA